MSLKTVPLESVVVEAKPGFASGDDLDEGVFQIRMNNITREGRLDFSKKRRVSIKGKRADSLFLQSGDVLFNATNSPDLVGKSAFIAEVDEPTTFSNHFIRLRTNRDKLDGSYLAHWLHAQFRAGKFKGLCRQWVNQATVSRDALLGLRIPLLALPEQRRIAAILDQADALRAKRREALAQLDQLAQSIFIEMFGDPVENPKNWPTVNLGTLVHSASDGPHVSPTYATKGVPFLSTRHVRAGEIIWDDLKYISQQEADFQWKKCKPTQGDILYTKGGTTGLAAVVRTDKEFAVWVHVALLKPNKDLVNSVWLESMLNSAYCYRQSQELTHGIANRDLGLKRMVRIKMYHPPLYLQEEFSRRVDSVWCLRRKHQLFLEELESLFSSLQYRAFRGEL